MDDLDPTEHQIRMYWRPGCGFCGSLRRKLHSAGVEPVEINIWDDPDAAAFVRAHARGHETVPTVAIGPTVLVNPSARTVLEVARDAGFDVPAPPPRWWERRRSADDG